MDDIIRYGTQGLLFVLGAIVSWIGYKIKKKEKQETDRDAKIMDMHKDHEIRIRHIEHVMGSELSEVKAMITSIQEDLKLIKKFMYHSGKK